MKAVPTYHHTYSHTHARIHSQTLLPFLPLILQEGAPDLLLNLRTQPTQQHAHPPTQTDSPVQEAQHGEDQHDQVLLFGILVSSIFVLSMYTIYFWHSNDQMIALQRFGQTQNFFNLLTKKES